MKQNILRYWPVPVLALALFLLLAMNIRPYGWNLAAVFHMDHVLEEAHPMPKNFVILGVPSYDGAQYYQVARNIPILFHPSRWDELQNANPGSYAYQRFLLPLTAYVVSLGRESALPFSFVFTNIAALLLTAFFLLRSNSVRPLYAAALILSPTAAVAMHFTLAEPLTILLITASLLRIEKRGKIDEITLLLLSLLVLAREVNILFVLFLIGHSLLQMRLKDAVKLLIPIGSFFALHTFIYVLFGNIPFLMSTAAHDFPGSAAYDILVGHRGYDRYTLSSVALLLGFVLPALFWVFIMLFKKRTPELLPFGSLCFLCLMLIMPDYIWGSITSIGRVITPVYPLTILALAQNDKMPARLIALSILLLGIGTSIGLALQVHPFTLA